jgi:cell division protein FtsI/penicillin-binding protein 2
MKKQPRNLRLVVVGGLFAIATTVLWVRRQCSLPEASQQAIRELRGVDLHREADRVYPFGRTGAKVVGFVGHDARGMAGVEASFDEQLAGEAGWEIVQRDGRYRSRGYHTYAEKRPRNGKHVVLTIDAGLQEIAEIEIRNAVERSHAQSGSLIIMQCRTGEILSLAEYPAPASRDPRHLVDSLWTLHSITHMYEPGSTFKLVTASMLLEKKRVNSFDVFDAENGRADLDVAVIRDSHPHGHLTFREAFLYSSNIVMAKASRLLEPKEFIEGVLLFGFGAKTGIELPGEHGGLVNPLEDWSERTQVTMAFGQEIGVTPLQMINAFAAIADGGRLKTPRILKSIIDEDDGDIEMAETIRIRNVVSADTARRLREFCRAVVEEGTGKEAALAHLTTAGKTGTAEKAMPGGGYSATKFVSSFIGFAPADNPEIACLVVLDEPSYANRFGGVSAAPVFARINETIANSSSVFDGVLSADVLQGAEEAAPGWLAPNFLRYTREKALERARNLGINVLCKGQDGEVVAQDPDPGVAMGRDEVLRLFLSGASGGRAGTVPDLRGLPIRLAKRRTIEAGFRCEVVGSGVVRRQRPGPGDATRSGIVKIFCEDKTAR